MPSYSVNIPATVPAFNLTSKWRVSAQSNGTLEYETTPTTATYNAVFGVFLPANSVVKSAYVHSEWGSPNTGYAIKTVNSTVPDSSGNVRVALDSSNGTKSFEFKFKANGSLSNPGVWSSGIAQISNVYLHIEYDGEELSDDTKALTGTATAGDSEQHWLKGTGNSGEAYSFTISGIPSGAVVTRSTLSFYNGNTTRAPGYSRVYWGSSTSGTSLWAVSGCANANVSVDITGRIKGNGSYSLYLYATARSDGAQYYSYFQNIKVTVEYTYYVTIGKATAPTSIAINGSASAYIAQNGTATLTWSGGSGGTNNAKTGYKIYCNGSLHSTQGSSVTSLSIPAKAAGTYLWTVRTACAEKDSADSAGVYLYSYSSPAAPLASVTPSVTLPELTAVLSWAEAESGVHNAVTGYQVYRATSESGAKTLLATQTETSYEVTAPASNGLAYYFFVVATGERGNSGYSDAAVLWANEVKANPPSDCVLNKPISHEAVTLSWTAAKNDDDNPITGYEVYRCESSDRVNWGGMESVAKTTATSLAVDPPETYGNFYQFYVRTCGTVGVSDWVVCKNTLRREHIPFTFTDETLTVLETPVKAAHMTELQTYTNALLDFYFLGSEAMTNIVAGETSLGGWTNHVGEIRAAIDKIPAEHAEWKAIPINKPEAAVIIQLRTALTEVENPSITLGTTPLRAGRLR